MSIDLPQEGRAGDGAAHGTGQGLHVPARGGTTTWFNGDIYTVKLSAQLSGGGLGLIEATVPPGGGPAPHIHRHTDETFYLVSGELEFLDGERTFTAGTGDLVHLPRNTVHRFFNPGLFPATMLFIFTPGGAEQLFVEGGDDPRPGMQVQPWGPERINEHLLGLLEKYDTTLPPAAG
jgi:quercetin dioxygenase-like cupin family protein